MDNNNPEKTEINTFSPLKKTLEQVAATQRAYAKALASITIPMSGLNKLFSTMTDQQKLLQNMFRPYIELQRQLNKQVTQITEAFRNIIQKIDFKKLGDIAQALVDEGVRLDVLIKTGWWYCPSMIEVGADEIKKAALEYNRGDKHAMTNLMKKSYQQNNYALLRNTVNSWKTNQLFKDRFKVIEDALDAHTEGKYTLSIPALLPLAEGVAADYCQEKGIDITSFQSRGGVKVEKAFEELARSGKYPFKFPDLFLQIIADVIYQHTGRIRDPFRRKLNRHGVLHGSYIHYYDAPRSLRCFLFLDALSALK